MAFTNVKALFRGIQDIGYTPISIEYFEKGEKNIKYNYANLVKVIKQAERKRYLEVAEILCENRCRMNVFCLMVKSK